MYISNEPWTTILAYMCFGPKMPKYRNPAPDPEFSDFFENNPIVRTVLLICFQWALHNFPILSQTEIIRDLGPNMEVRPQTPFLGGKLSNCWNSLKFLENSHFCLMFQPKKGVGQKWPVPDLIYGAWWPCWFFMLCHFHVHDYFYKQLQILVSTLIFL